MAFDPKIHQVKLIIIKCGEKLFPEEKNITELYEKTSALLGIPTIMTHSGEADHLPTLNESLTQKGFHILCPQCQSAMEIFSLCPSCKDSEGGKYHTMVKCEKCSYTEKSEKFMVQVIQDLGMEFTSGTKEELGIRTVTDKGIV